MFIKLYKLNLRRISSGEEYYLSEIMVNPTQIVYMSEDTEAAVLMKEGKLNLGLHKSASFTKLRLLSREGREEITVVEAASAIEKKILSRSSKQLLRD